MKATSRGASRRWSVRLMTVSGIEIRVHATMLLLVWLVVVASAGEPGGEGAALAWLVFLFGSVLLHELAHSLVALHVGVGVREIELLPIGGVSKMDRIPDRPAHETAIAAAGPLTSVAIGLGALGAAVLVGADVWPPDVYGGALLQRLGWLNLLLAGFNLLPALPLDGGRVFRALLEPRVGPNEATRIAARVGRSFAVGMIVLGVLVNIWLILIGVFVYVASETEEAGSVIHERLGRLHAADVMVHQPLVVSSHTTLDDIAHLLPTTAQRQFPVVDGDTYLGMVDAAALLESNAVAGEVMEPTPAVSPDTPLDELALVDPRVSRAVAVVSGAVVVGLVQLDDVQRLAQQALRGTRS
jgi:stage IV sporulation protein FB